MKYKLQGLKLLKMTHLPKRAAAEIVFVNISRKKLPGLSQAIPDLNPAYNAFPCFQTRCMPVF
ncbi:MAG: hypothetical protein U0V75_11650 [Ferruginibacter sp.]